MYSSMIYFHYQNMRGLRSQLTDIFNNPLNSDADNVCLTETWLNSSMGTSEIFCDSFEVFCRDRDDFASTKRDGLYNFLTC